MPGLPEHELTQHAVELSRQTPSRPAIEILDLAMRSYEGTRTRHAARAALRPDSACVDPLSAFADLLRRAFAPEMDPRELSLVPLQGRSDAPDLQAAVEQATDRWQAVVEVFAERYRLWEARG